MTSPSHHSTSPGLEYEFYIPTAVWDHPATVKFLATVYALVEGATILGGARGVWRQEQESTNIVRVLVKRSVLDAVEVVARIRREAEGMMQDWGKSPQSQQESFLYTVRDLTVHQTTLMSR